MSNVSRSLSFSCHYYYSTTIIPSDHKRKREEEEEEEEEMTTPELAVAVGVETNSPLSHSPIFLPSFQLQPSTPDPYKDLMKIEKPGNCFRCGEQGHWALDCRQNSSNNKTPVSSKTIYCRCGHGFCDVKTCGNERNYGRKYYVCPIKRGARCKDFIKWCDDPIDESYFNPPSLPYPECKCGAGVCRRIRERREFVCPIKQDHGSCGYRVSEDEWHNNTIQQSNCQNDNTDNSLGNNLGEDPLSTSKRMRVTNNSENPSPVAVSESPHGKDGKSSIQAANSQCVGFLVFDDDDDAEGWQAIEELEAELSSQLSTPSSIQRRQSVFERDISAADPSLVVPEQASTPNGELAVNSGVSKHVLAVNNDSKDYQFLAISPVEASKEVIIQNQSQMSKPKILRMVQRGLLSELENPREHESMIESAEAAFSVLDSLGIECKQFSDHVWDFIDHASSIAEIDKTLENSPTLEEHNKFLEGEKARLAHIKVDWVKTGELFETSNKQKKLLSEEVSRIESMLHEKQAELKCCELETAKIATRLGDIERSMSEADVSLKDRVRQAEMTREKSVMKQAKQVAAKKALEKAKLELQN